MWLSGAPSLDENTASEWLDVEYSTANRLIGQLKELIGKEWNRFYWANEVFKMINKPTDQL